jgi:hypothetical protein
MTAAIAQLAGFSPSQIPDVIQRQIAGLKPHVPGQIAALTATWRRRQQVLPRVRQADVIAGAGRADHRWRGRVTASVDEAVALLLAGNSCAQLRGPGVIVGRAVRGLRDDPAADWARAAGGAGRLAAGGRGCGGGVGSRRRLCAGRPGARADPRR